MFEDFKLIGIAVISDLPSLEVPKMCRWLLGIQSLTVFRFSCIVP
jgi:hypothetical protein